MLLQKMQKQAAGIKRTMKELNSLSQTYQQSAFTSCMQKDLIQYRIEEREQKNEFYDYW